MADSSGPSISPVRRITANIMVTAEPSSVPETGPDLTVTDAHAAAACHPRPSGAGGRATHAWLTQAPLDDSGSKRLTAVKSRLMNY